ncbi:MAG: hypothetical protein WBM90_06195 [Acidimicrobiia bacterium]
MGRAFVVVLLVLGACSGADGEEPAVQRFPDVVDVGVTADDGGTYLFSVTISSPYDTPARYADAWRVTTEDGTVLGERVLLHDHAGEQPFTRTLADVSVPPGVDVVVVEARDLVNGWGGSAMEVTLPPTG